LAILKNTIRLDNQMSKYLDEIKNSALEARSALGGWEERIKAAEVGLFRFGRSFDEIAGKIDGKKIEISVVANDESTSKLLGDIVKNVEFTVNVEQVMETIDRIERLNPEINLEFSADADSAIEAIDIIENFNPEINVKFTADISQTIESVKRIENLNPEVSVNVNNESFSMLLNIDKKNITLTADSTQVLDTVERIEKLSPEVNIKFTAGAKKVDFFADNLKRVEENATDMHKVLEKIPGTINDIADYMTLVTEKSEAFKKSFGVAFEDIIANNEEMLENFYATKEQIVEMTDAIHEKVEAIEATGNAIEEVGNKAGASSRGMNQMAGAAARLLSSLGVIPKSIAQGMVAVTQLNRTIQSTIPTAAKLTAMLGPITLIATGVMAIVNTISMLRRGTDDEALPSIGELISRAERLSNESERLSTNLAENIELMHLLGEHGASDAPILRFSQENELLKEQIDLKTILAGQAVTFARYEMLDELFGERGVDGAAHERTRRRAFGETVGERLGTRVRYDVTEIDGGIFHEVEKMLRRFDNLDIYERENLAEHMGLLNSHMELLEGEYADAILNTISHFNELNQSYVNAANYVNAYDVEIKELIDTIDRHTSRLSATAAIHERVHNHMTRSYRDTYAAAESVRGAHHALQHAIEGTSSAYATHLDYFNKIMNLSPQYFNMLFDERGALLDVEDAVYRVTQAQIELMGVRQANAFLDMVGIWDEEGNALGIYTNAINTATDGVWGLVAARTAALRAGEKERLMDRGYDLQSATIYAQRAMAPILQRLEMIQSMTATAQDGARERGVFRPDGAMLVADVGMHDIIGEFIRVREDVARRDYMDGAFQTGVLTMRDNYTPFTRDENRHPVEYATTRTVVVNIGGYSYSPQVYPTELSAKYRADLVREGAQNGARLVAVQIEEAMEEVML